MFQNFSANLDPFLSVFFIVYLAKSWVYLIVSVKQQKLEFQVDQVQSYKDFAISVTIFGTYFNKTWEYISEMYPIVLLDGYVRKILRNMKWKTLNTTKALICC